jgi:hypothetical protein
MNPEARTESLLVTEFCDDLVVYDKIDHRVHSLNRGAALIWRNCDGRASLEEITAAVRAGLNLPSLDTDFVLHGLDELQAVRLLKGPLERRPAKVTARQITRRAGLAAGLAAIWPAIQSITAPTPVMAMSSPLSDQ